LGPRAVSTMRRFLFVASVILILLSLAMGFSGDGTARAAQTYTVQMGDDYYYPYRIVVNVGDTVVWDNVGSETHTVTSDTGQAIYWNSGDVLPQSSFSYTFTTAGNFTYGCFYHPSMTGEVDVLQPAPEFPGYVLFAVLGMACACGLVMERRLRK